MEEREMELRLAVVQPENADGRGPPPKNVDRAVAYIRQAARDGAKLVMLRKRTPALHGARELLPHEPSPPWRAGRRCTWSAAPSSTSAPGRRRPCPCYTASISRPDGQRIAKYRRRPRRPWIYEGGSFWDFKYQEADELPVWDTEFGKLAS